MSSDLNTARVVVFGGSPNWIPRLRARAPHFEFRPVAKQRDESVVSTADIVCVDPTNFSHKGFEMIRNFCRYYHKPIVYIQGSNVDRNLQNISTALDTGRGNCRYTAQAKE